MSDRARRVETATDETIQTAKDAAAVLLECDRVMRDLEASIECVETLREVVRERLRRLNQRSVLAEVERLLKASE